MRCGKKEGESELDDLNKAKFYLNKLISFIENQKTK
jgi:hypothetical protein